MKVFKIILITASLIITIVNVWKAITAKLVVNWLNLTSLAPILIALYYEWDWLFIKWNQLRSWFLNKTVRFNASFHLNLDEDNWDINDIEKKLSEALKYAMKQNKLQYRKQEKISIPYTKVILITEDRLMFPLKIIGGDNGTPIVVSMNYQVSSKNINQCWQIFQSFEDKFTSKFIAEKQRYDILLDFSASQQNPFYRLTLKALDKKKVNSFNLNFVEGSMRVDISNNQLHASSKTLVDLNKILQEYVPLTHVI